MKTSKQSQVSLAMIPKTKYLSGWTAGFEGERDTWMIEERGADGIYHSKVFSTPAAAVRAIREREPKGRAFVRAMPYTTHIPKHARGMPLFSTVRRPFFYLD